MRKREKRIMTTNVGHTLSTVAINHTIPKNIPIAAIPALVIGSGAGSS